ncbi:hypothetical protein HYU06_05745 [Candidatus Woesearchaeota archaeon]|nr:hypothetical protein [Candidatus Woesearchaeota archaeon]
MRNIKDNVLEMKNISELMVDLGYTAIFLKEPIILKEVEELHHTIKHLEEETVKILFKVRESDEQRMMLMDLIDYIKDIANSALQIAELSKAKELPDIVNDILESTDKRVIVEKILPKSTLSKKSVGAAKVATFTGARIIAIQRDDSWNFKINRDTILLPNDLVIATGSLEAGKLFKALAEGK